MTCTHKQFINKILQHTTSYNALCTLISGCIASLFCGQLGWKSVLSDIIIIIFYTSVVKIPRVKRKKRKLKKVVWKGGQRSGSLLQENVSCKSTALKHWIVMEMCWYKYSLSRTSFVLADHLAQPLQEMRGGVIDGPERLHRYGLKLERGR